MKKVRINLVIPADLLATIDSVVGKGQRSSYFSAAVAERVARQRFALVVERSFGVWPEAAYEDLLDSAALARFLAKGRNHDESQG